MSKMFKNRMKKGSYFSETEDVNPMNYIGNLSDAMLVLAVGILLALVMAYNVKLESPSENSSETQKRIEELQEELDSLKATADDEDTTVDENGLSDYGRVLIDEEGNLYVIENQ